MSPKEDRLSEKWKRLRQTSGFRNAMLFLIFMSISTIFWFFLALNDSAQDTFNVRLSIANKPDSITFLTDLPDKIHVGVRDKGTSLWRSAMKDQILQINFRDYASNGIVKMSQADIQAALKNLFGNSAQIVSVSIDSLVLRYTDNKGKRVPVVINSLVIPSSGSIVEGKEEVTPTEVVVYGEKSLLDTIKRVYTDFLELKDISETTTVTVGIKRIPNSKIVPSVVNVTFPVEPLVMKEALVTVTPINVPDNESLLLFPSKVPVKYYVAMTRLEEDEDRNIQLSVDYNELNQSTNGKLKVNIEHFPERLKNLQVIQDSIEYAIVKQ